MGNFAVARGMKILASLIEKEKKKKTLKLHLNSMTAVAYPWLNNHELSHESAVEKEIQKECLFE